MREKLTRERWTSTGKIKLIRPTPEEDATIQRGIDADPDNPEWTAADFARARPLTEEEKAQFHSPHTIRHVSDAEYAATKRHGRPPAERTKEHVNLRLDARCSRSFARAALACKPA